MKTLDMVLSDALAEEARYAPEADDLLARMFGPGDETQSRRSKPTSGWLVPAGLAAATALIVSVGAVSTMHRTHVRPAPTPSTPATTTVPREGRLPGYLDLSAGAVHIELATHRADDVGASEWSHARRWDWTLNCTQSVLAVVEPGDVGCAGSPGEPPEYEALVSPGNGAIPRDSDWLRLTTKVDKTYHSPTAWEASPAGHPAWVRTVGVSVRYDCGTGCHQWADRTLAVISYPGFYAQVMILAESPSEIDDIAEYIYVE